MSVKNRSYTATNEVIDKNFASSFKAYIKSISSETANDLGDKVLEGDTVPEMFAHGTKLISRFICQHKTRVVLGSKRKLQMQQRYLVAAEELACNIVTFAGGLDTNTIRAIADLMCVPDEGIFLNSENGAAYLEHKMACFKSTFVEESEEDDN